MKEHTHATGHKLWMDLTYGNVYCGQCHDYVYDAELMNISEQHHQQHWRELGLGTKYVTWTPSSRELELLTENTRRYLGHHTIIMD